MSFGELWGPDHMHMPLVSWQQGESERDRPAQRCRELALGDKLANRCKKQQASETDTRPAPLRKRDLCCRFGWVSDSQPEF